MTADTTNNSVDNTIDITFADNSAWRAAVTGVTYNGNAIAPAAITWSVGHLVLDPSQDTDLQTPGTANIVVTATGYPTATVSQTLLAGEVASLNVTTPPVLGVRNGVNAVVMATQPVITLLDQYGNDCTTGVSSTANVVVTVKGVTTPVGATVGGTTTKAAVAGVATFTNLTVTPGDDNQITDLDLTFTVNAITVDVNGLSTTA